MVNWCLDFDTTLTHLLFKTFWAATVLYCCLLRLCGMLCTLSHGISTVHGVVTDGNDIQCSTLLLLLTCAAHVLVFLVLFDDNHEFKSRCECRLSYECTYSDIVIFPFLCVNIYLHWVIMSILLIVMLNSAYNDARLWSIHHSNSLSDNTLVFFHILIWCGGYQIYNIIQ